MHRISGGSVLSKFCSFCLTILVFLIPARLSAHQPHDPVIALALSPNYAVDQTVFIATGYLTTSLGSFAVFKSTDGGVTWAVMTGLPNNQSTAIQFSPSYSQDGIAFVGNVRGLYRTNSRGNSWSATGRATLGMVRAIAISPGFATDATLYVLNNSGGLFVSSDQGNSFSQLPTPISNLFQIAISPSFTSDHTIVAGSRTGTIIKSADGGQTWQAGSAPGASMVTALAFSQAYATDRTLFASTYGGGIVISADGGTTWTASNSGLTDLNVTDVELSPNYSSDSTLYVSTAAAGVFKSSNRGGAWSALPRPHRPLSGQTSTHFLALAIANTPPANQIIFLGMYEGLWSLQSPATNWAYNDILPTRLVRSLQLSPNYPQDHTIIATTYGGGVEYSSDAANTWQFQDTGLINSYPDALAISPNFAVDGTFFAGIVTGPLSSTTLGGAWNSLSMLGVPVFPRAIAVTPTFAQDSTVFIGVDNRETGNPVTVSYQGQQIPTQGFFVSGDRGNTWAPAGLGGTAIDAIAISPGYASDNTIFVGGSTGGLFKSTDRASTWISIPTFANVNVPTLALSPQFTADQTVFVGTSIGIFKSTDGGASWKLLMASVTLGGAVDIVLSPTYSTDQTLFVATLSSGLLRSTDGGNSFVNTGVPDNYVSAVAVSAGFAQDHTVVAAAYSSIYKSTDGGFTWMFTAEPGREEEIRPGLTYQGTWTYQGFSLASTENYSLATQSGASLTVSFVGTGIRWIGSMGSSMSAGTLQLDGAPAGTVVLTSPLSLWQQVLWSQIGLSCSPHTLTITAVPVAGTTALAVDAFDILRDSTCAGNATTAIQNR